LISYNELKPGTIFILDNEPYEVLEFNFLRMQQRKPVAQTKIKNLITGKILNRNFQSTESFEEAEINYRKVKFLYAHRPASTRRQGEAGDKFVFCELNNPSARFEMPGEIIGDRARFLKPNSEIEVVEFDGRVININLPIKMTFKVIEAPPSIKGNTAQGGNKQVKIETDAMIAAPLFIQEGDNIEVNTTTGEYTGRINK
jgi:elongation factor P